MRDPRHGQPDGDPGSGAPEARHLAETVEFLRADLLEGKVFDEALLRRRQLSLSGPNVNAVVGGLGCFSGAELIALSVGRRHQQPAAFAISERGQVLRPVCTDLLEEKQQLPNIVGAVLKVPPSAAEANDAVLQNDQVVPLPQVSLK